MNALWTRRKTMALWATAALFAAACGGAATEAKDPSGAGSAAGAEGDAGAAPGAVADTGFPAPSVGRRGTEKRTMSMNASLVLSTATGSAAGSMDESFSFEETRRLTVLGAEHGAVTSLGVLYGVREGKGLEEWTPLPTEGAAYTVSSSGGSAGVEREDGATTSAGESAVALEEYGWVGGAHPLTRLLSGASDGPVPELGPELGVFLLGRTPATKESTKSLEVVVSGRESRDGRDTVLLSVKAELVLTEARREYVMTLEGAGAVDVETGWVAALDLSGNVAVSGTYDYKGKELTVAGKGPVTLTRATQIF